MFNPPSNHYECLLRLSTIYGLRDDLTYIELKNCIKLCARGCEHMVPMNNFSLIGKCWIIFGRSFATWYCIAISLLIISVITMILRFWKHDNNGINHTYERRILLY